MWCDLPWCSDDGCPICRWTPSLALSLDYINYYIYNTCIPKTQDIIDKNSRLSYSTAWSSRCTFPPIDQQCAPSLQTVGPDLLEWTWNRNCSCTSECSACLQQGARKVCQVDTIRTNVHVSKWSSSTYTYIHIHVYTHIHMYVVCMYIHTYIMCNIFWRSSCGFLCVSYVCRKLQYSQLRHRDSKLVIR